MSQHSRVGQPPSILERGLPPGILSKTPKVEAWLPIGDIRLALYPLSGREIFKTIYAVIDAVECLWLNCRRGDSG